VPDAIAPPPSFADTLRQLMDAAGVTGSDLARALGSNKTSVSRWRTGEDLPRPMFVVRIAQHLGVEPARLLEAAGYLPATEAEPARLPTDQAEVEWLELFRQLPTEHRSPIQELLRLLAVPPARQPGKRRPTRADKEHEREQLRRRGLAGLNTPRGESDNSQSDNRQLPALVAFVHSLLKIHTPRLSVPALPILN